MDVCAVDCQGRLSGAEITVGWGSDGVKNQLCGSYGSTNGVPKIEITCHSELVGRYVHVRIPGGNVALTLCEVEVLGENCKSRIVA